MNKYYIPQIEDINIGYECEVKESNGWYPWSTYSAGDISDLSDWIKTGEVRTKYLTKEDIESLGWKLEESGRYRIDRYHGMGYGASYYLTYVKHFQEEYFPIPTIDLDIVSDGMDYFPVTTRIYNGRCPSINELKYLMKLLNIK